MRDTPNIGDRSCSPYDYFSWADAEVRDIRSPGSPYKIGIYGGGRIFGGLAEAKGVNRGSGVLHIAWGVGTLQNLPISLKYYRARRLCSLVGSRDWGDERYIWAPCASCMSPFFDHAPKPSHEVVFYYHRGKTSGQKVAIPEWMPSMSNEDGTFEDAINFIASGETVVSNSYHGVFWGLLLGRRVVCVPFSKKFTSYRFAPHYSSPKTWQAELTKARAANEMLEICRTATREFAEQVEESINVRFNGQIPVFA